MSRSAFVARFTELVGEPVMPYVARWWMQVARRLVERRERDRRGARGPARLPVGGRVRAGVQARRRRRAWGRPAVARGRGDCLGLTVESTGLAGPRQPFEPARQ